MKEFLKKTLRIIGPYPYNPTLIFLFFFAFYFSRFVTLVIDQPKGAERWFAGLIIILGSLLPASLYASFAHLLQKYRKWSSENLGFYVLEVGAAQALLLLFSPIIHLLFEKYLDFNFITLIGLNTNVFLASLVLALILLALMHSAERVLVERLKNADTLVEKLEADRRELVLSDEELRRQTSQFLHDRVQSDLMVVAMKLKGIQGHSSKDVDLVLSKAITRLESTRSSDLRNLVQILTPNFERGGLKESLEPLRAQYESNFGVSIEFGSDIGSLSENQQLGIFRIIEQALLNALVHGPASNVTISLIRNQSGGTQLVISDDGPGLDPNDAKSGVGTAIIDSWIGILNGSKEIDSTPGHGYRIKVVFPTNK